MKGQAAIESPCWSTAGSMKGQAAMEYLMTYGWALLVIVAVIAVLLIINPFSAPAGCRFDLIGFQCANPLIKADPSGVLLYVQITNSNNNAVKLNKAYCTTDRSTTLPVNAFNDATNISSSDQTVQKQQTVTLSGIKCYKSGTTEQVVLSAGNDFAGKLWLFYNNDEDASTYPNRTVSASITGKATQG